MEILGTLFSEGHLQTAILLGILYLAFKATYRLGRFEKAHEHLHDCIHEVKDDMEVERKEDREKFSKLFDDVGELQKSVSKIEGHLENGNTIKKRT